MSLISEARQRSTKKTRKGHEKNIPAYEITRKKPDATSSSWRKIEATQHGSRDQIAIGFDHVICNRIVLRAGQQTHMQPWKFESGRHATTIDHLAVKKRFGRTFWKTRSGAPRSFFPTLCGVFFVFLAPSRRLLRLLRLLRPRHHLSSNSIHTASSTSII